MAKRFAPNRLDFHRPASFPIDQRRGLVTTHAPRALDLIIRELARDRPAESARTLSHVFHQSARFRPKRLVAEDVRHRGSFRSDGKTIKGDIPYQLAPPFADEIVHSLCLDLRDAESLHQRFDSR